MPTMNKLLYLLENKAPSWRSRLAAKALVAKIMVLEPQLKLCQLRESI
jgi:hypothetical protein